MASHERTGKGKMVLSRSVVTTTNQLQTLYECLNYLVDRETKMRYQKWRWLYDQVQTKLRVTIDEK